MDAPSSTPISEWIESIKKGDSAAQVKLWQRYYQQLVLLAHNRLRCASGREDFDGEDILQCVFLNVFQQAERGGFPDLADRRGLWRLLIVLTERRLSNKLRAFNAKKRGGRVKHQPIHLLPDPIASQLAIPECPIPSEDMTEEFIDTVRDALRGCDDVSRKIALYRMEGFDIVEISEKVGVSRTTVNRKIQVLKLRLQTVMKDF